MATGDHDGGQYSLRIRGGYPITTEKEVTWLPGFSLDYRYDFIGDEVENDSNFIGVSAGGFITNGANSEE